eukprot:scaffold5866_cov49-Attheya_sp.AAC.4
MAGQPQELNEPSQHPDKDHRAPFMFVPPLFYFPRLWSLRDFYVRTVPDAALEVFLLQLV